MRDLRDPEKVGLMLKHLRQLGVPALQAADELPSLFVPDYRSNETCIDKYGRADDTKPRFEEIQTR